MKHYLQYHSFSGSRYAVPIEAFALPASVAPSASQSAAAEPSFHDIKALPEFSPVPLGVLAFLLVLIALLIAFWRMLKIKARKAAPLPPPPTAEQIALSEIARLEQMRARGAISLRELGTALSLALRRYLETRFGFPASDQTAREVVRTLEMSASSILAGTTSEKREEYFERIRAILHFCDKTTFAHDSEEQFSLSAKLVLDCLRAVERVVRDTEQFFKAGEEQPTMDAEPEKTAA